MPILKSFILKSLLLFIVLLIVFRLTHLLDSLEKAAQDKLQNDDESLYDFLLKDTTAEDSDKIENERDAQDHVIDYDTAYQRPAALRYLISEAEKLYLNDKYLRAMRLSNLHPDSKMSVDRATRRPIDECLRALDALDLNDIDGIRKFVADNLYEPGVEIVPANLTDWTPIPKYVFELKSNELVEFALALNQVWTELFRRVDLALLTGGRVSSHLPMKHGFVVPGGRFLEIYYWDTYWTMEGLLLSGMFSTAKQMLDNLIAFIDQFGFIPNGSRIYYLNRSHPPLFAHMLELFYNMVSESGELDIATKKRFKKFVLDDGLRAVRKEYDFWMTNRSVEVTLPSDSAAAASKNNTVVLLNIYRANTDKPRPESYFEDLNTAVLCKRPSEHSKLYMDLSTAAESGYDFSSRWFNNSTDFCSIQTSDLVPVDLNAIIFKNELIIAKLCRLVGDRACSRAFTMNSLQRQRAINALMFNESALAWADMNYRTGELNDNFYITNLMPLLMDVQPPAAYHYSDIITRHIAFFDEYPGGIPVSLVKSQQQWDFPNAWAPNQHLLVKSLLRQGEGELALRYARKFFNSVHEGWKKSGFMFEKYDVRVPGKRGSGGEYVVQKGFGWTNGVIISFIHTFRDDIINV